MYRLRRHKLVYLATPYSKYQLGPEQAFIDAARLAGKLLLNGVTVFSPISHSHPLAIYTPIDQISHDIWIPFDAAFMEAADAMVIGLMPSWDTSYGIEQEIKIFMLAEKPIYTLCPETLEIKNYPK
jgi:hypothetical protein